MIKPSLPLSLFRSAGRFLQSPLALFCISALSLSTAVLQAQTVYEWTNADGANNNWNTAGNWNPTSGAGTTHPGTVGGEATDTAIFSGVATTVGNPNVNAVYTFTNLDLQTAGWTLGNNQLRVNGSLSSAGAGTNVIHSLQTSSNGGRTYTVGGGNTLQINNLAISFQVTFTGGGTAAVQNVVAGTRGLNASGSGTTLYMNATMTSRFTSSGSLNGGTIGGTGTFTLSGDGSGGARLLQATGAGSILAPGGDGGSYGSKFATLSVTTDTGAQGAERVVLGNDTVFQINLGSVSGENSRIDIEHLSTGATGGYLQIGDGVDLRLLGDLTAPAPGAYTIANFNNPNENMAYGTFSNVFYNGSMLTSGSDYNIAYNENDITLTVIPEPATAVLLIGSLSLLTACLSRRRLSPHKSKA